VALRDERRDLLPVDLPRQLQPDDLGAPARAPRRDEEARARGGERVAQHVGRAEGEHDERPVGAGGARVGGRSPGGNAHDVREVATAHHPARADPRGFLRDARQGQADPAQACQDGLGSSVVGPCHADEATARGRFRGIQDGMRAFLVVVVGCLASACAVDEPVASHTAALSDELAARRAGWLAWAPRCEGWPSKPACEDGDTTLFNGLLCAAGEPIGCAAVKAAQDGDGRFWRSPRRTPGNLGGPKSFSRDMTMGVLLYLATTGDAAAAQQWLAWIDDHRPCTLKKPWGGGCLVRGPHRVCTDDVNATCTITPGLWALMGKVWDRLGLNRNAEMKLWSGTDTELAALEATFTEPGYQLHLKGVAIFLKEKLDVQRTWRIETAAALVEKQPENPFFRYLAEGASPELIDDLLARCPAAPPASPDQWAWERADAQAAWLDSMGWDCVFLVDLLQAG
jgi:hypothetical protein